MKTKPVDNSELKPAADAICEWLTKLKHRDAKPCVVTIAGVSWPAADYLFSEEFTKNLNPNKKNPKPERRLYIVGKLPKSKRSRDKVCYLRGEQTWYISGYYRKEELPHGWRPLTPEQEKEIHPWGEHFMMGEWDCKEPIDYYEEHPYTRVPMTVTYFE